MHFRVFFKVKIKNEEYFLVAKISKNFLGAGNS